MPAQGVKPSSRFRRKPSACFRSQGFFFGNAGCADIPLGDSKEIAGPAEGFLDFGFFGSRLPRFIPLAIIPSGTIVWLALAAVGAHFAFQVSWARDAPSIATGLEAEQHRAMSTVRRPRHRRHR